MAFLRRYKELFLGLTMILVAVVYLAATTKIQIRVVTTFNSRFVPYILGAGCLLLGALQCLSALKAIRKGTTEAADGRSDPNSVVLTFLLIIVYISILKPAGFIISTIGMMFLMMMLLSPREKWNFVQFAIVAVAVPAVIYVVFRYGLELMLPGGITENLEIGIYDWLNR